MKTRLRLALLIVALSLSGLGWAAFAYLSAGARMDSAATAFLASLSDDQRAQATMEFEDPARLDWHFIPKDKRKGLQIKEMNSEQRRLAHALLESGVSHIGYDKATVIMSLEAILHELEKNKQGAQLRDTQRYYFTVFGKPGMEGRWGWSVEGHHLSLNFVVKDGKVASVTPAFYGANPGEVKGDYGVGPKKGTRVLAKEEELAFELVRSLSKEQRAKSLIAEKAPNDLRGAGEAQPPDTAPEGLSAAEMTKKQVEALQSLIEAYLANMPDEVGEVRRGEVRDAGIEKVYFAWAGADRPGIGHYYRLQGPSFLVEFVNTQPDSAGNPANHIHSVWRQTAGDFGVER